MTIFPRPSEWVRTATGRPAAGQDKARSARYFAFLSYSHRDEPLARWLHDSLEKFRVPSYLVGRLTDHGPVPRKLSPVFRDIGDLAASDDLGDEICEAIAASRFMVVLCSPAAAASRWTNAEIEAFKRVRPEGCILAAIVDGEPFASDIAGREHEECLPPALRFHYDRRGRRTTKRAEPLAADLRQPGEPRRKGFLKLVAGMLGLGLDDLVQREAVRKQRRLALITAASFAGMVLASALAVTAIQARDSARDQRRQAESLVGFMIGDLREKLEPVGRLDALDGVGTRVLAYYQKQDTSELSDAGLLQRSRALTLMGEIAYARGDFDRALQLYSVAFNGTAEAVRRAPDDPQRLYDHAQNVAWIGEIARMRGRTDRAEAGAREYKRLAERMVAIDPDNMRWRMESQYASANLGIVLLARRRFEEAGRQFEQALETIRSLANADPTNADYQKSLSESLAWLADARLAEGRIDEAIAIREQQVALLGRLMRQHGGDVGYQQRAIPAHQATGLLLAARGREEPALEHFRIAVTHAERLIPTEPENTLWQEFAGSARLALAEHLIESGDRAEAAEQARRGCRFVERLVERDSSVIEWRLALSNCYTVRAQLALAAGSYAQAIATAQRAIALADSNGGPSRDGYALAKLHRLAGDAHRHSGDAGAARSQWLAGLALLPEGEAERPSEMNQRATLLERLGRTAEARQISARLDAIGYRRTI